MRVLIYGMQSSGASTLAYLMAQKPDCCAFVDIWSMYVAPRLGGAGDVVAKTVVTTAFPLRLHQRRYQPDVTILFLRDPLATYRSLMTKVYRHDDGFVEEKLAVLDRVFRRGRDYDVLVRYEDMTRESGAVEQLCRDVGWKFDRKWLNFPRPLPEIVALNEERYPEIRGRLRYGIGNFRRNFQSAAAQNAPEDDAVACVRSACPSIWAHYATMAAAKVEPTSR
jgi:hypothetical protein